MIETIGFLSLVALLAIFALKFYNVASLGKIYPAFFSLLGFSLAFIFWLLYFMSLAGSLSAFDSVTMSDENIVISSNEYISFTSYLGVVNLLIALIGILTTIEILLNLSDFSKTIIKRPLKRGRK